MPFDQERAGFEVFRREITSRLDVRTDMENAISEVYWTYDTSIRENRFIVGGVVELIVGATLRACGVLIQHKGIIDGDIDLLFDDGEAGYSIKALFKKGSGTRLVNTMGSGASIDRWHSATLFLVTDRGIVYADPSLDWWMANKDHCLTASGDAISVKKRCIEKFAEAHPQWWIPCRLPTEKDRATRPYPAKTHTADVAAQILMHKRTLSHAFMDLRPGEEIPGHD